jgi:hypothetical protein
MRAKRDKFRERPGITITHIEYNNSNATSTILMFKFPGHLFKLNHFISNAVANRYASRVVKNRIVINITESFSNIAGKDKLQVVKTLPLEFIESDIQLYHIDRT